MNPERTRFVIEMIKEILAERYVGPGRLISLRAKDIYNLAKKRGLSEPEKLKFTASLIIHDLAKELCLPLGQGRNSGNYILIPKEMYYRALEVLKILEARYLART